MLDRMLDQVRKLGLRCVMQSKSVHQSATALNKLRWGVVGSGKCAKDFCNVLDMENADHEVKAVASTGSSAGKFAEQFGIPVACSPVELVARTDIERHIIINLTDPDRNLNIDVVYVATSHKSHHSNAGLALEANKAVVCEKPMGVTPAEVRDLVTMAKSRNLFLVEATWSRFMPSYRRLSGLIQEGAIGDPFLVASKFFTEEAGYGKSDTASDPHNSVTLERGQYPVALSTLIFDGPPIAVKAVGYCRDKCDDTVSAVLEFPEKKISQFSLTRFAEAPCDSTIYGMGGAIYIPDKLHSPAFMTVNGQKIRFPLPGRTPRMGPFFYDGPAREGFMYLQRHVKECITRGMKQSPLLPLDESVMISDVLHEIVSQCGVIIP